MKRIKITNINTRTGLKLSDETINLIDEIKICCAKSKLPYTEINEALYLADKELCEFALKSSEVWN